MRSDLNDNGIYMSEHKNIKDNISLSSYQLKDLCSLINENKTGSKKKWHLTKQKVIKYLIFQR